MNPVDDIVTVFNAEKERGWRDNPILVDSKFVKTARAIAKRYEIPVIIEGVWRK